VGVIEVDLPLHLVLDGLGDGKVRLPQVAPDDPFALFLELPDIGSDLEGVLGVDESDPLGE
jgi:hypothetical protein